MKPIRFVLWMLVAILSWATVADAQQYFHYPNLQPRYSRGTFRVHSSDGRNYVNFTVDVPVNTAWLSIRTGQDRARDWGTCYLYARYNREPNLASYTRRARGSGHEKTINISRPATGRWYIRVYVPRAASLDARMNAGLTITTVPYVLPDWTWSRDMLSRINRVRQSYGRTPLVLNERLELAAQFHAREMVFNDYCSSLGRRNGFQHLYQRLNAVAYRAQNQRQLQTCTLTAALDIVNAWMANASYRSSIIDNRFTEVGFGQLAPASGPRGSVAIFANPR